MWTAIVGGALSLAGSAGLFGGGKKSQRISHAPGTMGKSFSQGPGDTVMGLSHPGVNQRLLRDDPYYAEAAFRANELHRQAYGVDWVNPDSSVSGIQQAIGAQMSALRAEGWTPPEEKARAEAEGAAQARAAREGAAATRRGARRAGALLAGPGPLTTSTPSATGGSSGSLLG